MITSGWRGGDNPAPADAGALGLCCGSRRALDFLPGKQYGAIAACEIYENTSIALEYLYEEYDNRERVTGSPLSSGLNAEAGARPRGKLRCF